MTTTRTMTIITTIPTIGILANTFPAGPRSKTDKSQIGRNSFVLLAQAIPFDKTLAIKILDVGAGYGALTRFLLNYFSERDCGLPGRIGRDDRTRPRAHGRSHGIL